MRTRKYLKHAMAKQGGIYIYAQMGTNMHP